MADGRFLAGAARLVKIEAIARGADRGQDRDRLAPGRLVGVTSLDAAVKGRESAKLIEEIGVLRAR